MSDGRCAIVLIKVGKVDHRCHSTYYCLSVYIPLIRQWCERPLQFYFAKEILDRISGQFRVFPIRMNATERHGQKQKSSLCIIHKRVIPSSRIWSKCVLIWKEIVWKCTIIKVKLSCFYTTAYLVQIVSTLVYNNIKICEIATRLALTRINKNQKLKKNPQIGNWV